MEIGNDFIAKTRAVYHRKVYHSPHRCNTELLPLWYNPGMMNVPPTDIAEQNNRLIPSLDYLARSQMLLPGLLFLSSHAPLAFVAGQALWLLSPFEMLFPNANLGAWARLLSHPQAAASLKRLADQALAHETNPRDKPTGEPVDEPL